MGSSAPSREILSDVSRALSTRYPRCRLGNKSNPLDEYLYILLSLRTHEKGLHASYTGLKKAFPSWQKADQANVGQLAKAIGAGGLARQKAKRIKDALRLIENELGELSLRKLRRMSQEDAEGFLLRLPGVGLKSARCIMMYSLDFPVLPVDVHVARIGYRLGLVPRATPRRLHDMFEKLVPEDQRYAFHVYCVQHGRLVCRGQYPQCGKCCLMDLCPRIGLKEQQ